MAPPDVTILLAEDDPVNQQVAILQLRHLGLHNVDVVCDGFEVLEALRHKDYSLVLMDSQMPGLDGIEVTRRIRALGYSREALPIIALTANAFDEHRDNCIEAGMTGFITKPVMIQNLRNSLSAWLEPPPG